MAPKFLKLGTKLLCRRNLGLNLPNNRTVAEDRLKSLLRRFERDADFEFHYRKVMGQYIDDGYAQRIEPDSTAERQWFLPYRGVLTKSYSTKRMRIAFDSAAEFQAKSLNKALLSRPAMQKKLPSVILKFRQIELAICADISAMFSRIRLEPEDARYRRFLWSEKVKARYEGSK